MARRKTTGKQETNSTPAEAPPAANSENISAYFRTVFKENRTLLKERSNDELLRRWLADHPGETVVPNRVKQGLQNIKSVLRKKLRLRRKPGRKAAAAAAAPVVEAAPAAVPEVAAANPLETLEERIDDCLTQARTLDPAALADVIRLLRRARNEVVWKIGE